MKLGVLKLRWKAWAPSLSLFLSFNTYHHSLTCRNGVYTCPWSVTAFVLSNFGFRLCLQMTDPVRQTCLRILKYKKRFGFSKFKFLSLSSIVHLEFPLGIAERRFRNWITNFCTLIQIYFLILFLKLVFMKSQLKIYILVSSDFKKIIFMKRVEKLIREWRNRLRSLFCMRKYFYSVFTIVLLNNTYLLVSKLICCHNIIATPPSFD